MALIVNVSLSSGIVVDQAYMRVSQINGSKSSMNITVQHYINEDAFLTGKDPFCGNMYTFTPVVGVDAADFIRQSYEYLKTLPEFETALDN